jgi:hypothetical protein
VVVTSSSAGLVLLIVRRSCVRQVQQLIMALVMRVVNLLRQSRP